MHFGGYEIDSNYEDSSIIILPVPYDETSTYMKGADNGPDAILEASPNLEYYDIETRNDIRRHGIFTLGPVLEKSTPEAMTEEVRKKIGSILSDKKFPVLLGGNHSVSIGAFRAVAEKFSNLTILQLDAHSDLRNRYEGSLLNHACAMARARESAPVVQVGIRSMAEEELPNADWERIFPAHELYYHKNLYSKAIDLLGRNVWVTIDLDVFDPSIMPSTGTPEPGGPGYTELMHFLWKVAKNSNIVGFDVVELCPNPANKMPDFVAAKVVYQLLSYIFADR